jgi:release factor glutamine methyltransferase
VDTGVYVPRTQTEELARRAAALLPDDGIAVDLCCGSGAVAAHLARTVPSATVIGVDLDQRAAACARRNGVTVVVADLADAGTLFANGSVDVITAVAPYVPTDALRYLPSDVQRHEPRQALDGGDDGLALVRTVVGAAGRLLRDGGWLLLELGGTQDRTVGPDLVAAGFEQVETWLDEDGDLRGLSARRAQPRR